jgi:hypothetical protein
MRSKYSVAKKKKTSSRTDHGLVQAWIPKEDLDLLRKLAIASRDMTLSAYLRRLIDQHLKEIRNA